MRALITVVAAVAAASTWQAKRGWLSLIDHDPLSVEVPGPGDAISSAEAGSVLAQL